MLYLRCPPARPRQAIIVTLARPVLCPQRDEVEILLVRHMELKTFGRLAAITGRPAAAVDLAQDVLGRWPIAFDLDVLEQHFSEAELLGYQIEHLVVVFRLEARRHDLFAPLQ